MGEQRQDRVPLAGRLALKAADQCRHPKSALVGCSAPSGGSSGQWHPRHRGFTLIEVLVAGIILSLAGGVIAVSLSHGYRSLADARDERRAAALADELLTKIDLIGPARIASEGPRSGKFDGSDERFSWTADIASGQQGHLYQVTVTLSWSGGGDSGGAGEKTRSVRVQTLLNDPTDSRDSTLNWDDL